MASTIPYDTPEVVCNKRPQEKSPEDRQPAKSCKVEPSVPPGLGDSTPSDSGGASGSAGPLLPLKEDEDDDDELNLWLEELKSNEHDPYDSDFFGFVGQVPALDSETEERIFAIIESFQRHGIPVGDIEIGVEGSMAKCHEELGPYIKEEDMLVFQVQEDGARQTGIVKDARPLTKEELIKHKVEVGVGKFKELSGLHGLGCFERFPRKDSRNRVDTRWVINWKWVDGKLIIKCRLIMRGFRDRDQDLETFAGTATRSGQRVVNSITIQHPDFVLFSLDVSQAFAKGLTFEEYARLTGTQLRQVEFDISADDVALVRKLPGFSDFNPATEVLRMLKPIYGLKDAPRAWRKRLHQVLTEWGLCQLAAEAELYVRHDRSEGVKSSDPIARDSLPSESGAVGSLSQF